VTPRQEASRYLVAGILMRAFVEVALRAARRGRRASIAT
jgi:hypothetical protein